MKNLTHIQVDHCAGDISLLEFKQFCHRVWSGKHNYITIDHTITPMNGMYRQNFNRFYFPTDKAAIMEAYRPVIMEASFTYVLFQSPTRSIAAHLESYLLHVYYTSQLDNIYDDREIDQLELDSITWQRDYAQNKTWGVSRTSILEAMQCEL